MSAESHYRKNIINGMTKVCIQTFNFTKVSLIRGMKCQLICVNIKLNVGI